VIETGATVAFSWGTLALAVLGALVGGLILNVMPCVFPILSLKAMALARGNSRHARRRAGLCRRGDPGLYRAGRGAARALRAGARKSAGRSSCRIRASSRC
jgi:hypothetical protein